jgi:hypothetical protein
MDTFLLPLSDPPLKGFLRWTYLLSILNLHEKTLPWYYSNFIQLSCTKTFLEEKKELFFDFYRGNDEELYFNTPFLVTSACNYDILSFLNKANIIAYFVDKISSGYYPVVFIDESHIPHSASYNGGNPFPHHILLQGYNWTNQTFDVAMFDRRWMYGSFQITFESFIQGFFSMKKIVEDTGIRDQGTFFYKFRTTYEYAFDRKAVVNEIKDYLRSETNLNRINYNSHDEAFGLEVYPYLQKYYYACQEHDPSLVIRGVVRHLQVLWEHKKTMADRIKYYNTTGVMQHDDELLSGFEELTGKAEFMRNILVKHFRRETEGTFKRIIEMLDEVRVKEQNLMERLLHQLDS